MAKPQKKKKRVKRAELGEIELLPDAWERFEAGVKTIAKAKPEHRGEVKLGKTAKPKAKK